MAGEEAEKKKIAELDFGIQDAINSLDKVNQKLADIEKSSTQYADKIGKNLKQGLDIGNVINTNNVKTELNNVAKLTEKQMASLNANQIKNAQNLETQKQKEINKTNTIIEKENQKRLTNNVRTTNKIKIDENNLATYKEKKAIEVQSEIEKQNARRLKSEKSLYDQINNYAKTYLIYQGFNQLKRGISETINEMVEMQYQMVQIDRVLNDNSLNIDNYRDKLIQLAYDYGNSFDNVADITLRLAQAGFDADESLALTEKTLLALNTADLDATQATSNMIAVMSQFGKMTGDAAQEAKDYGDIIDKINKVADNFPTTSADILDALQKTGSAFNLAGASIDETIATIVAAEKASQRGGKVIGTALANITQQLKAEKKLDLAEQLGLDFFEDEAKTKFKPIMEIFQELSERMEKLKNEGKENSTEMQQLLEMFTVFRRNIGASLLGEMAGEDSTYAKVLETSLNSVGYSLEENAKHMQTAKAAQAQFNAELLKLKTEVWDNGLEDVFREFLNFGTDIVKGITDLIDKFGLLPTTVTVAVAAFTSLNKSFEGFKYNAETNSMEVSGFIKKIKEGTEEVRKANKAGAIMLTTIDGGNGKIKNSAKAFATNTIQVGKYAGSLVLTTAKTIALQVATVALNAAISFGLSLAIGAIVSALDNYIHAQEKAIEKAKELKEEAEDNASTYNEERTNIEKLRKEYEELAKKKKRTPEEEQKIYELQETINQSIKDSGKQVELVTKKINEQGKAVTEVNKNYDEQIQKIKEVEREKQKAEVKELKKAAENAEASQKGVKLDQSFWQTGAISSAASQVASDLYNEVRGGTKSILTFETGFNQKTYKEQINILVQLREKILKAEDGANKYAEALKIIDDNLDTLNNQQKEVNETITKYKDALKELYSLEGIIVDYQQSLNDIQNTYGDNKNINNMLKDLTNINTQFSKGKIDSKEYFDAIEEQIKKIDFSKYFKQQDIKEQIETIESIDDSQWKQLGVTQQELINNIDQLTESEQKELEAYEAIFTATTQNLTEGISSLNASFEDNEINFAQYSEGLLEAGENALALYTKQNELIENQKGQWVDAAGNVNEYANSLQNAIDKLSGMGSVLKTVGDNYDYIAEHANLAGEAAFESADVGSKAYTKLASDFATSLFQMEKTNAEAYNNITNAVAQAMGKNANETKLSHEYIVNALNANNGALNAALNEAAAETARANGDLTVSMGDVFTALGNAISNFDFKIKAQPYITGGFGLHQNDKGIIDGLSLPSFGFDVTGSGGKSIQELGTAISTFGNNMVSAGADKYKYKPIQTTVGNYTGGGGSGGSGGGSGSSGGSKSSGSSSKDTQKAEDDEYKKRLEAYKNFISDKEKAEQRWVKKQKELGQLTTNDELYITQQRIKRYEKYLAQLSKMTWLKKEDRVALEKEYKEQIEDLQLDYMGFLKDKLDEQIKDLKDANEKRIDAIEEEADKRIAALRKVEKENDRIRSKEEYERKRQEHLDDISYWEQRTGREAQEALVEAKKNLQELDREWKEQQEDWSIEEQIEAIEKERDAQIKAIEDAQQRQIDAWTKTYEARVKLFSETGKIVYDNTVIQSKNLYNAYKKNFVDPISKDLANLNKTTTTKTSTSSSKKEYDTYKIKSGDTLSEIASKYKTTVSKIMAANPDIKNKNLIYTGDTIKIPKFHNGGIVGGNQEAFALLKPHEVILKPEWAEGINRLAKMAKQNDKPSIGQNTTIEVNGDLVRIDANIKNQNDMNNLTKKIKKMLINEFNIKK